MPSCATGLSGIKNARSPVRSPLRPLPQSPQAEQGVLGCILLAPKECLGEAIEKLGCAEDIFYDLRHQTLFHVLSRMQEASEPIDLITLHQKLKDLQLLDQIGGIAYLSSLQDSVPSAVNLSYYLEMVIEKARLRRLISACTNTVEAVYTRDGVEPVSVIEEHEREILSLIPNHTSALLSIKEAVRQSLDQIEKMHANQGPGGLLTGFRDLDRLTCGLHGADMFVLAGRPGAGKTALALNIVDYVAVEQKLPTAVFSLEMSTISLVMRMLCARARLDAQRLRQGALEMGDFPKIASAAAPIAKAPLYIDDTPGVTLIQLRSRARRLHQLHGIKLFVIDYLQLLPSGKNARSRQEEVAALSSGVKCLARELNVPVLVLSQLNRDMEKGGGSEASSRKPRLSDLRDSGAVEQDADVVGLLWKPHGEQDNSVELVIAKQRNGPTGDISLVYLNEQTRFASASLE